MPYELFIALRYLKAKRKQVMVSVITLIAITAVAAGVAALIIVLAMMTGFREEFQEKILSGTAHLNLMRKDGRAIEDPTHLVDQLHSLAAVRAAAPTLYEQVLIQGSKDNSGAILKGVDVTAPRQANEIFQFIKEGDAERLAEPDIDPETGARIDPIIVGRDLAQIIGAKVGDYVTVLSPQGHLTPLGMSPKYRDFKIVGLFVSGLGDYDSTWAYISLDAARRLAGSDDVVQLIQVQVKDVDEVEQIGSDILTRLGDAYVIQTWKELNAPIYTALSYEKLLSAIALLIVIIIAALNIITVLVMIVMEKARDISILKSMGATNRSVMWLFILQGVLIGVVGLIIGALIGVSFCYFANRHRWVKLPPGAYALDFLPFHLHVPDLLTVAVVTLAISFLSTIYPAWNAARIQPVEGLRYE